MAAKKKTRSTIRLPDRPSPVPEVALVASRAAWETILESTLRQLDLLKGMLPMRETSLRACVDKAASELHAARFEVRGQLNQLTDLVKEREGLAIHVAQVEGVKGVL